MADTKFGEISVYEGDDGKAVWEFEGKVQSDIPLDTEAQDFAGAINELKKLSAEGGGDSDDDSEPNYISDPDWEIFKNLPEPASNQVIWGVRIIDTSYKKGGFYYSKWIFNKDGFDGKGGYDADQSSEVPCHIAIVPNRAHRLLDPDGDFSDPNNWYYCSYHIDWGDGTYSSHTGGIEPEVSPSHIGADGWGGGVNTAFCHLYSDTGLYIVTLTVAEPDWKWYLDNNSTDNTNGQKYYSNAPQCVFAKIGSGFENHGDDKDIFPLMTNAGMAATCKFIKTPIIDRAVITRDANTLKYIKTANDNLTMIASIFFRNDYSLEKIEGIDFSKIEYIQANAFYFCRTLKELSFENCTFIGANAFQQCISLKKIYLPNCTSIDNYAFSYCSALEEIDLPNCTSIGNYAFQNCSSLKKVNAPKCQSIGNYCFSGCNALRKIELSSLISAGGNAFPYGQSSRIQQIILPLIQEINWTMQNSYCLLEIICPNAKKIIDYAFQNCMALHTVTVSEGCTFGNNAFYNCYSFRPRPDGSIN